MHVFLVLYLGILISLSITELSILDSFIAESDNISRSSSTCLKRLLIFRHAIFSPLRFLKFSKLEIYACSNRLYIQTLFQHEIFGLM